MAGVVGLQVDQQIQVLGEAEESVQVDGESARDDITDLRLLQRSDDVLEAGGSRLGSRYMLRRYSPPTS